MNNENNVLRQEDPVYTSFECHANTTERPDFPLLPHSHYFTEILRVRSGSLKVTRSSKTYLLSAGDAIFINSLSVHSIDYAQPGQPAEYYIIRFDPELLGGAPSYTPDLRAMLLEAERCGFSMCFTAAELNEHYLGLMMDACLFESSARSFGYDLRIRSILFLVTTEAVRRWIAGGFTPQNYASTIDPIYTLPSYIARNIQTPLKVEELAEYCGLSYPWFARKFHSIFGMSCKEFIEKIRIRRVEHYLQFTDCNLNYICRHCGYADPSHLVRDFRRLRNTTPGQFRQACRKKAQGTSPVTKTIDMQRKNG